MKRRKVVKALYGRIAMLRLVCPNCNAPALVVDGAFLCCGRLVEIKEGDQLKLRRMCEGARLPKKPGAEVQRNILAFQNNQCVYCGVDLSLTKIAWDHFICFAYSCNNGPDNYVASCRDCNQLKSSLLFRNIQDARSYIRYHRSKRGLPNFIYSGGEYVFEGPGADVELAEKADPGPAEAFATHPNTQAEAPRK